MAHPSPGIGFTNESTSLLAEGANDSGDTDTDLITDHAQRCYRDTAGPMSVAVPVLQGCWKVFVTVRVV
jgi:hypothetical protein